MRKLPTPPKYERYYYKGSDRKAANRYNKHHITFKHESRELVVYDKTYQIVENGLQLDEEKLDFIIKAVKDAYLKVTVDR